MAFDITVIAELALCMAMQLLRQRLDLNECQHSCGYRFQLSSYDGLKTRVSGKAKNDYVKPLLDRQQLPIKYMSSTLRIGGKWETSGKQ